MHTFITQTQYVETKTSEKKLHVKRSRILQCFPSDSVNYPLTRPSGILILPSTPSPKVGKYFSLDPLVERWGWPLKDNCLKFKGKNEAMKLNNFPESKNPNSLIFLRSLFSEFPDLWQGSHHSSPHSYGLLQSLPFIRVNVKNHSSPTHQGTGTSPRTPWTVQLPALDTVLYNSVWQPLHESGPDSQPGWGPAPPISTPIVVDCTTTEVSMQPT